MSDSYAIYFSSDNCTHIAPIKTLTTLLKQLTITSFLFVPCAHNILLDYFASDHTLPKIARGSIDPLTVLKGSHPLKLFQLYQTCVLGYFTLDQFEFFSFNINTFGVLSHNKIKTIIFFIFEIITNISGHWEYFYSSHCVVQKVGACTIPMCMWLLSLTSCYLSPTLTYQSWDP